MGAKDVRLAQPPVYLFGTSITKLALWIVALIYPQRYVT
jgi:hypothetical protein